MNRVLLVAILVVFGCACAQKTLGEEIPESMRFKFTLSDIAAKDMEFVSALAGRVKEQGYIPVSDNARFISTMERLAKNKILGLTAVERQRLVKDIIGVENYSVFEKVFMEQLDSSDIVRQRSGLRSLGFPLFSLDASDKIKTFVFYRDRKIQLLAIKALVYLDVAGADYMLYNVLLCGILSDFDASKAIEALYITNNKDLDSAALGLFKRNSGPTTFQALLPVLKERDDYSQIVAGLFKSNLFYVPDKEDMELTELAKANAEHDLLEEIFENTERFMEDEAIKKKVITYAKAHDSGNLPGLSLLILEKSGEEREFFTNMLRDPQLMEDKRHTLELIISRIEKGEHLK